MARDPFYDILADGSKRLNIPEGIDLNKMHTNGHKQGQSIALDGITPKPIQWLHPGRIPKGKITILAGDPDVGKTFLTLDIAARVSTGNRWPDGAENHPGNVLILSAEDDLADTIVPRLQHAGANLSRIYALQSLTRYDAQNDTTQEVIPTLTNDIEALREEISIREPALLIIDPINAYLPGIDTHRDAELRAKIFAPLKNLAEEFELACVCVMHLNKSGSQSAKHRVSGSVAYVAASRATWLITTDKNDPTRKLMLPIKFNIGPKPDGLAYKIVQNPAGHPVLAWEDEPVDIDVDEALQPEQTHSSEREAVKEFLIEILENGPVPQKEIFEEAKGFEFAKRTLYRAKKDLKIESKKPGGVWHWYPPNQSRLPHLETGNLDGETSEKQPL